MERDRQRLGHRETERNVAVGTGGRGQYFANQKNLELKNKDI